MNEQKIMAIASKSKHEIFEKTGELLICLEENNANIACVYKVAKISHATPDVKGICLFTFEPLIDCDIRNKRGKREICPYSLETCI